MRVMVGGGIMASAAMASLWHHSHERRSRWPLPSIHYLLFAIYAAVITNTCHFVLDCQKADSPQR
jgi:hypothetical protein